MFVAYAVCKQKGWKIMVKECSTKRVLHGGIARIFMAILMVALCLCLCACGKSEEVKAVEEMVAAIGEISEDNLEAALDAMAAYDDLSKEDAEKVKNYDKMTDAVDQWLTERLKGEWVYEPKTLYNVEDLYEKVDVTLGPDGNAVTNFVSGPWSVEDGVVHIDAGKSDYIYYVFYEEGNLRIGSIASKMMPCDEYKELLDNMLVTVELNESNVSDYCEVVIYTEEEADAFGVITGDTRTYVMLTSKVYDQGLLYLDGSDDLAIELLIPEHPRKYQSKGRAWRNRTDEADTYVVKYNPYGSYGGSLGSKNVENEYEDVHEITADQITFGRVAGKITFIRKEYVQEVKQREGSSSRMLVLTNGEEMTAGTWRDGLQY